MSVLRFTKKGSQFTVKRCGRNGAGAAIATIRLSKAKGYTLTATRTLTRGDVDLVQGFMGFIQEGIASSAKL